MTTNCAVILYFDEQFDFDPTPRRNFFNLKNDAFWAFLFGSHSLDKLRKRRICQVIDLIQMHGSLVPRSKTAGTCGKRWNISCEKLNTLYFQKFGRLFFDGNYLCAIFGAHVCNAEDDNEERRMQEMIKFFEQCELMFCIEDQHIMYVLEDYPDAAKDIFVSSRPIINGEITRNLKIADKIFEIVPEQRRINILELIDKLRRTKEYKEVKEKNPNLPHVEPVRLIGFLQLYWSDVFNIEPDHHTGEVWIKRQVLHHQKPSQERKYMTAIMESIDQFPLPANLLTDGHVVQFYNTYTPSDGFFLRLLELGSDLNYVVGELEKLVEKTFTATKTELEEMRLHINYIFKGTCCLALMPRFIFSTDAIGRAMLVEEQRQIIGDDPRRKLTALRRCIITGQSNGKAMVQCVDYPFFGLVDIRNIFKIPTYLVGIRQTGVYAVLNGCSMATQIECNHWEEARELMADPQYRLVAHFYKKAERTEYSGREKYAIYTSTIRVNELGRAQAKKNIPSW